MISIVTPLYNKGDRFAETLQSALRQSFAEFELLVVNDGSTDGGEQIARACNDPRVRVIDQPNAGVAAARNTGIRAARFPLIAFLDADDLWDPDYLACQMSLVQEFPEAAVFGCAYRRVSRSIHVPKPVFPVPEGFRGLITEPWGSKGCAMLWTSALVVKKEALEAVGLFDPRIAYGEDLDLWFRLLLRYKAAFQNKVLASYIHDAAQKTADVTARIFTRYYPCYIDKFAEARRDNADFRRYYDRGCLERLFPYYASHRQDNDTDRVLAQINLDEHPASFRFRFRCPRIYCYYCRCIALGRAIWKRLTH